jgi:hypothetical protein
MDRVAFILPALAGFSAPTPSARAEPLPQGALRPYELLSPARTKLAVAAPGGSFLARLFGLR